MGAVTSMKLMDERDAYREAFIGLYAAYSMRFGPMPGHTNEQMHRALRHCPNEGKVGESIEKAFRIAIAE